MNSNWYLRPCPNPDEVSERAACDHQLQLTKPPGSLGYLETIATRFASWQSKANPSCDKILIRVFAGDHGVCQQNISAFPQQVTAQMVQNFVSGGAAISVLARRIGADFAAVNAGVLSALDDSSGLFNDPIVAGTKDFSMEQAMSLSELEQCLNLGREQIDSATTAEDLSSSGKENKAAKAELFIGGEMGIGNTTSASALYSVYLNMRADQTVGPGTGLDSSGMKRKVLVIERALSLHNSNIQDPLQALAALGGAEIAALTGAYIRAAQSKIPVLVDGFITTAAAVAAVKINPSSRHWMLFAHKSAEPAHQAALEFLNASPILDLGMRLGEGSGAALAVNLIQSALDLHNNMATFNSAGVSQT